jgi:hypothetical protein
MGRYSFLVRLALRAVAVSVIAWSSAPARAADVTPPPVPVTVGAPAMPAGPGCAACEGGAGCTTCKHGLARASCPKCGKLMTGGLLRKSPNPYPVTLCPGACFGYFQTQWRKWEEVCPYPYLGTGPGSQPGTELPTPRPTDPKMPEPKKVGSTDRPAIPVPQGTKFGP